MQKNQRSSKMRTDLTIEVPIYRAKRIDSEEYVIGFLANPTPSLFYI